MSDNKDGQCELISINSEGGWKEIQIVRKEEKNIGDTVHDVAARLGFAFDRAQIRQDGEERFVLQFQNFALVDQGIEYDVFRNSVISDLIMTTSNVRYIFEIKGKTKTISDEMGNRLAALCAQAEPDAESLFNQSYRRYFSLEGGNGVLYHGNPDSGAIISHDELIKMFSNEIVAIARGDGIRCNINKSLEALPQANNDNSSMVTNEIDMESSDPNWWILG